MKRDIYGILEELRAVPDSLHYYIGANAYESLLVALEPLIADLEEELNSMIPEWVKTTDKLPGDREEIIAIWIQPDGIDALEWYMTTDDPLKYWNLNSSNLNEYTSEERLFTHWRLINQLDYPMEG